MEAVVQYAWQQWEQLRAEGVGVRLPILGRSVIETKRMGVTKWSVTLEDAVTGHRVKGTAWSKGHARRNALEEFVRMMQLHQLAIALPRNIRFEARQAGFALMQPEGSSAPPTDDGSDDSGENSDDGMEMEVGIEMRRVDEDEKHESKGVLRGVVKKVVQVSHRKFSRGGGDDTPSARTQSLVSPSDGDVGSNGDDDARVIDTKEGHEQHADEALDNGASVPGHDASTLNGSSTERAVVVFAVALLFVIGCILLMAPFQLQSAAHSPVDWSGPEWNAVDASSSVEEDAGKREGNDTTRMTQGDGVDGASDELPDEEGSNMLWISRERFAEAMEQIQADAVEMTAVAEVWNVLQRFGSKPPLVVEGGVAEAVSQIEHDLEEVLTGSESRSVALSYVLYFIGAVLVTSALFTMASSVFVGLWGAEGAMAGLIILAALFGSAGYGLYFQAGHRFSGGLFYLFLVCTAPGFAYALQSKFNLFAYEGHGTWKHGSAFWILPEVAAVVCGVIVFVFVPFGPIFAVVWFGVAGLVRDVPRLVVPAGKGEYSVAVKVDGAEHSSRRNSSFYYYSMALSWGLFLVTIAVHMLGTWHMEGVTEQLLVCQGHTVSLTGEWVPCQEVDINDLEQRALAFSGASFWMALAAILSMGRFHIMTLEDVEHDIFVVFSICSLVFKCALLGSLTLLSILVLPAAFLAALSLIGVASSGTCIAVYLYNRKEFTLRRAITVFNSSMLVFGVGLLIALSEHSLGLLEGVSLLQTSSLSYRTATAARVGAWLACWMPLAYTGAVGLDGRIQTKRRAFVQIEGAATVATGLLWISLGVEAGLCILPHSAIFLAVHGAALHRKQDMWGQKTLFSVAVLHMLLQGLLRITPSAAEIINLPNSFDVVSATLGIAAVLNYQLKERNVLVSKVLLPSLVTIAVAFLVLNFTVGTPTPTLAYGVSFTAVPALMFAIVRVDGVDAASLSSIWKIVSQLAYVAVGLGAALWIMGYMWKILGGEAIPRCSAMGDAMMMAGNVYSGVTIMPTMWATISGGAIADAVKQLKKKHDGEEHTPRGRVTRGDVLVATVQELVRSGRAKIAIAISCGCIVVSWIMGSALLFLCSVLIGLGLSVAMTLLVAANQKKLLPMLQCQAVAVAVLLSVGVASALEFPWIVLCLVELSGVAGLVASCVFLHAMHFVAEWDIAVVVYWAFGMFLLVLSLSSDIFVVGGYLLRLSGLGLCAFAYYVTWEVRRTIRKERNTEAGGQQTPVFPRLLSSSICISLLIMSALFRSWLMFLPPLGALISRNVQRGSSRFVDNLFSCILQMVVGVMMQSKLVVLVATATLLLNVGYIVMQHNAAGVVAPIAMIIGGVLFVLVGQRYEILFTSSEDSFLRVEFWIPMFESCGPMLASMFQAVARAISL